MTIKRKINHCIFVSAYIVTVYSLNLFMFPFSVLKKLGFNTNYWISLIYRDKQFLTSFIINSFLETKTTFYFNKDIKKKDLFNKPSKDGLSRSITITNHLSEIDAVFIAMYLDEFLVYPTKTMTYAKEQLRYMPLIGWLLLNVGTIFVKNKNKTQDKNQHIYIQKKIVDEAKYSGSYNFNIFIEGTTFRQDVHDYRNQPENRNRNGIEVPKFKNVMVPRTEGLWLLETNIPVDYEYHIAIKYILPKNMKDNEQGMTQLFKGRYPSEVHIFVDKTNCKTIDRSINKDGDIDRKEFDNNVVKNFKRIDNILDSFNEWETRFQKLQIKKSIFSRKMIRILLVIGLSLSMPFISFKFYMTYLLSMISFNLFLGYTEFD